MPQGKQRTKALEVCETDEDTHEGNDYLLKISYCESDFFEKLKQAICYLVIVYNVTYLYSPWSWLPKISRFSLNKTSKQTNNNRNEPENDLTNNLNFHYSFLSKTDKILIV